MEQSQQDLLQWEIFVNFSNALYEDVKKPLMKPEQKLHMYPITILVLLNFLMLSTKHWKHVVTERKEQIIANLMDIFRVSDNSLPDVQNILEPIRKFMSKFPTYNHENVKIGNLWTSWMKVLYQTAKSDLSPYEYMPASSLLSIWEQTDVTSQMFVSRAHLTTIFNFYMNYEPASTLATKKPETNFESCPSTATTSMLPMSARTQTRLAVVFGSKEAGSGDGIDERDIDDEFSSLTSRFQTGKTSLDILLQKDTQSKTLKAEVRMEDFVYDLKIYKCVVIFYNNKKFYSLI